MIYLLREYTEDNIKIAEYTKDGETVSHRVETPITSEDATPIIEQPTMDEQILFESKYQTLLLETMTLGGTN